MLLGCASIQANQTQGNLSESRCSCREDKAVSTESSFRSVNAFGQANSGCSHCVGERKWPYDIAGVARLPAAGAFDTIFKVRGFAKYKRKSVLIICVYQALLRLLRRGRCFQCPLCLAALLQPQHPPSRATQVFRPHSDPFGKDYNSVA
jgi:hypothetical protein